MSLFRCVVIAAILGLMLGIASVSGQVNAELPQFKSGASVTMGVPVDFNILSQRVNAIYDVVESDDSHIVWKFTGTTGDWVYVFADGRIVVASTVDFNLDAKDTLTKELNDVMDMLNAVFAGIVSDEARNNALDSAIYYATDPGIYHKLKYDFNSKIDLTLFVPECSITKARLTIAGCDYNCDGWPGQNYYIDETDVASCSTGGSCERCYCFVSPADITTKILQGLHKLTSSNLREKHTMTVETLTSPSPPRTFVLYGPEYNPWINETGQSMTIGDLNSLIAGNPIKTTA